MSVSKTLVIGDVHGRQQKMLNVLVRAGAVDAVTLKRVDGFRIIQLGDLVSLGYDEVEADFYKWATSYIDEKLIGNHELPAFYFNDAHTHLGWDADSWHGWYLGRDKEAEILVRRAWRNDEYRVAASVGPHIVTHAGILPAFQVKHFRGMEPSGAVDWINQEFFRCIVARRVNPLFQGGASLFWVRIRSLMDGYGSNRNYMRQIVGHTPSPDYFGEVVKDYLWNLDTPPVHHHIHGGVSGLLFNEANEIVQYIYEP